MPKQKPDANSVLKPLALALCLSVSGFALSTGNAQAAAQVGTSAAVRGDVFVRGGTAGEQHRAAVSDSIHLDDQIVTRQESALQILLLDRSVFTVGENCNLVIDRFIYDPDTGAGEMAAQVAQGVFRFMSGQIGGNNPTAVSIETPSAMLGTRGTFIEAIVGEDAAALADQMGLAYTSTCGTSQAGFYILRGPGLNTNSLESTGVVDVTSTGGSATISEANYAVFVPCPGAEPIGPFPVPDNVLEFLNFFLRSAPNGPSTNPVNVNTPGGEFSGQSLFNGVLLDPPPAPPQGQFDPNTPMMYYPPIFSS